jgi:hypothetical protein
MRRAQIRSVLDAVTNHLISHNVQRGGRYGRSVTVDQSVADAREAWRCSSTPTALRKSVSA